MKTIRVYYSRNNQPTIDTIRGEYDVSVTDGTLIVSKDGEIHNMYGKGFWSNVEVDRP